MSRRTQRATKYIFQTLANVRTPGSSYQCPADLSSPLQLSENFIFIYLGLSLFTQSQLVYKPLFIIVTVAAVVASRYCAVFPIAALVNAFKRARNARRARRGPPGAMRVQAAHDEELSQEYQMMLFWAGLRGAVGFALSAGIEGQNAAALQTTVLVAVVITVVAFGGTTAQMLQILGIRTGVEDEEGSSDEDEAGFVNARQVRMAGVRRRQGYSSSRGAKSAPDSRPLYRDDDLGDEEDGASAMSDDVLPGASHGVAGVNSEALAATEDHSVRAFLDRAGLIMRDGRWFSTLDQRYLTPLFTNSVASRKHEERRAARRADAAASAAAAAADDAAADQIVWGLPGDTGWAPPGERDADEGLSESDDDGDVRRLGAGTGTRGARHPMRRSGSRGGSDEDVSVSRPASSRVSGAFTPTSARQSSVDHRSSRPPDNAWLR